MSRGVRLFVLGLFAPAALAVFVFGFLEILDRTTSPLVNR